MEYYDTGKVFKSLPFIDITKRTSPNEFQITKPGSWGFNKEYCISHLCHLYLQLSFKLPIQTPVEKLQTFYSTFVFNTLQIQYMEKLVCLNSLLSISYYNKSLI